MQDLADTANSKCNGAWLQLFWLSTSLKMACRGNLKKMQDMVTYKAFNLLKDFAPLGKFDMVFCFSALIYFYQETKKQILDRIAKMLKTDGVI